MSLGVIAKIKVRDGKNSGFEAVFAAHREYPHFREGGRKMGACMAGAPEVELLDGV